MMNRTILLSLMLSAAGLAQAQTSRLTLLQNARNLVVTEGSNTYYYMVNAEQNQVLYPRDGKLVIAADTFDMARVSLRLKAMPRFALDEDSTAFSGKYGVEHGLLAFRRTLATGQWNSIIVPFALTGSQVRDAFGADAQLASVKGATDGTENVLEFQTVDLDTPGHVLQAGVCYLLKPTREPDLADGQQTTVAYGTEKVKGPLYAIPGVTMQSGQVASTLQSFRSGDDKQAYFRLRGTYTAREGNTAVTPSSRPLYALGDDGLFAQLEETTVVKAFRYWIENVSAYSDVPVRFVVDGANLTATTTAVATPRWQDRPSTGVYDLSGRRLSQSADDALPKGVYIVNGKKIVVQ